MPHSGYVSSAQNDGNNHAEQYCQIIKGRGKATLIFPLWLCINGGRFFVRVKKIKPGWVEVRNPTKRDSTSDETCKMQYRRARTKGGTYFVTVHRFPVQRFKLVLTSVYLPIFREYSSTKVTLFQVSLTERVTRFSYQLLTEKIEGEIVSIGRRSTGGGPVRLLVCQITTAGGGGLT